MPFAIVQAGSTLKAVSTAGVVQTLTLPTDVTIDATIKGAFHILNRQLLFTGAATINLWIDPTTFTVRPMVIQAPTSPPTFIAASTGLTGDYIGAYSFAVIDTNGDVISESSISPLSDEITLANQGINWTGLQTSPDSTVNARVLYRSVLGANGEIMFRRAVIADNVNTSFLGDNMPDAALELLPVFQGSDPPAGTVPGTRLSLAIVYRDRLFAVAANDPDQLRWSEPGSFSVWPDDNGLGLPQVGEDEYGAQGFLARKEELVILKRSKVLRLVGSSNDDYEIMPDDSSQGVGCIAPRSCVVIEDVGYFLGLDGVYTVDSAGVTNITREQIDVVFTSDLYLNRDEFDVAEGGYNPETRAYEIHLVGVGASTLNVWYAFDIAKRRWYGPHSTTALTPTARGMLRNSSGLMRPTIGGADGYLYYMNQATRSDTPGATPGSPVGISISWITSWFDADSPDFMHFWGQVSIHQQVQAAGTVLVDWIVSQDPTPLSFPSSQSVPLTTGRYRMTRFGTGRLMRMRFTQSTAAQNVQLWGIQVPFNTIGRR